MTAAAAIEHQGHKSAPDEEREESAKAESDPAVFGHWNVIGRRPCGNCPEERQDKYRRQCTKYNEMARA